MKILFDLDSIIHASLYKVVSISEIKEYITKNYTRESIEKIIVLEANERLANMCLKILEDLQNSGVEFDMSDVEYYLTSNIYSFRKLLSKTYKAQRKPNKWVNKLRQYIMENESCFFDLQLEADDLIYNRAYELNLDCVVVTIDKDLNQIEGWKFDVYKEKTDQFDSNGNQIKRYRGLKYITKEDAEMLIWQQMLEGDMVDNIQGIKGIGKVKAKKIISNGNPFIQVAKQYFNYFGENAKIEFRTNYRLLKIGTIN